MELNKEIVAALIKNDDLSDAKYQRFVEEPEVLLNHDYQEMNHKLHTFLDKLERVYSQHRSK